MLQDVVLGLQRIPEYLGRLLDDRGERNDVDNAAKRVTKRMLERKGERRESLAAAGGDGEREQTRR